MGAQAFTFYGRVYVHTGRHIAPVQLDSLTKGVAANILLPSVAVTHLN